MNTDELRGVIAAKKKTQRKVAKRLGIAERTISVKLRDGNISVDEAIEIAEYLKLSNKEILRVFFNRS